MPDTFLMDASAEKWMLKTVHKNFWRVHKWYDLDDLIQDGYMCWYYVVNKYSDSARERCLKEHKKKNMSVEDNILELLMFLFTRTFYSHITELANSRTKTNEVTEASLIRPGAFYSDILDRASLPSAVCDTYSAAIVSCAPQRVRDVLLAYTSESNKTVTSAYRIKNGVRETLNDRFCRIAGVDPESYDLVSEVKGYLKSIQAGGDLVPV